MSQIKHNECLRYHAEIVRLSSLPDQREQSDAPQQTQQDNDENRNLETKVCIFSGLDRILCVFACVYFFLSLFFVFLFFCSQDNVSCRFNK